MWLVYLRFDNENKVETYHVTAANREEADHVLRLANLHGLTASSKLVEHAFFYTERNVKPKQVPSFHFYKQLDFLSKWNDVESQLEDS